MSQNALGSNSSKRHTRDQDSASTANRIPDIGEWEANEALRQRELEEARGRAAQMEKTMRWWSDCTANWREKWSKVRNERNKAREECKLLRSKLEVALKDSSAYKREKEDYELQNDQLKKEVERIHLLLLKHAGQSDSQIFEALGEDPLRDFSFSQINLSPSRKNSDVIQSHLQCERISFEGSGKDSGMEEYILQGAVPKPAKDSKNNSETFKSDYSECINDIETRNERNIHKEEYDEEYLIQKLSLLQLRLEEATKTLQVERDEKSQLHQTIDRLTTELQESKDKCDELREARQEIARELLTLQDQHDEELRLIKADLHDETTSREGMDRRLNDLRAELERLQTENAAEWGKRERLETEKLSLERDNKKLRAELRDLQERLEKKGRPIANADAELRHLQQEFSDKNKEIAELKHSQNKLKKLLQDKMTELAHAMRRAEQYEAEVKKLRSRVEELKRDLAVAEDELDTASNNIRKLQRTNDELQEQVDGFQVQLQHLHSRLRSSSSNLLSRITQSSTNEEESEEDSIFD